jgi:hypothetical protein
MGIHLKFCNGSKKRQLQPKEFEKKRKEQEEWEDIVLDGSTDFVVE